VSEATLLSRVAWGAGAVVVCVVLVAGAAGAGIGSLLLGGDVTPSASAVAQIPAAMLALYQEAATTCPGLPWTVLAAIGTVESSNGTSDLPGVHSGANAAGAEDIWTWDQGPWHVRDEGRWPRACGVSAVCEARRASGGRHTAFVACGADAWRVSGVAGGVAE
jgi:hypothetical protein